ncbi:MAG: putative molybdenum carrier protein [Chthoniobacterales bacterium]|nr:putative molybdenum carrier protein [Chthoniobacterales bacterium]MCX7713474.1 putative molybdenum carrier protein [Chthoniobacterales bacterium]
MTPQTHISTTVGLKITSGGQTGIDRAALDVAIELGIPHGGWCPKQRWAEDGVLPEKYTLRETPSQDPSQRTLWNVRDSDATLILCRTTDLTGGTLYTKECCEKFNKPYLLWKTQNNFEPLKKIINFLVENKVKVLNIAGPRESQEPGIYLEAKQLLKALFCKFLKPESQMDNSRW